MKKYLPKPLVQVNTILGKMIKRFNVKPRFCFSILLMFGLLTGLIQSSEAQLYYLQNAGNGNTASTSDALPGK